MSTLFNISEENNNKPKENQTFQRRNTVIFTVLGNTATIRLKSPRTMQACIELGITEDYFDKKWVFSKKTSFF